MENTVNFDKRVYLNSRNDNQAGYDRIGGKSVFRPGYGVASYVCCYCTKCGAEFLGYVERLHTDEFSYMQHLYGKREDENDPKLGNHCPICGNSFAQNDREHELDSDGDLVSRLEYRSFHGYSSRVDYFAEKANYRKEKSQRKSGNRLLEIENNAKLSTHIQLSTNSTIKTDPEKLKEYISHLIQVEGNIYALKQRLTELYFRQSENEKYIVFCENIRNKPMVQVPYLEKQISRYGIITDELKEKQKWRREHYSTEPPKVPSKPQLLRVGALDFILGNAEKNKKMMAEYEQQLAKYRQEFAKYNAKREEYVSEYDEQVLSAQDTVKNLKAEIAERKALVKVLAERKLPSPALAIKSMLDKEIEQAEKLLYNLASAREQLYGFNIVFGKYRDVVALTTFYEYLMAGRCTSLEGANGAYNLYESEIRANLIISKLDDVITRLDKVIDNQYTIASMMNNINSQLGQLNDTMGKAEKSLSQISQNTARIAENSEVIAHNTAVSAYYSKVNAELTNSMGYLMAYKL